MPTARFKDAVIAQSNETKVVEGNHYFPPEAVNRQHLQACDAQTVCGWKGTASYYHVVAGGETCEQAAWYYSDPKEAAAQIKDHVAFWKDVVVTDD